MIGGGGESEGWREELEHDMNLDVTQQPVKGA